MKLARGEYELSDEAADRLGCVRPSLLLNRLLFFFAVVVLGEDLPGALTKVASKLPKRLPNPWEDLNRFSQILLSIESEVAVCCANVGIEQGWFISTACVSVYVYHWHSEGRSFAEFFAGIEPLIKAAAKAWWPANSKPIVPPAPWNSVLESETEF